jgi:hypothetical protein
MNGILMVKSEPWNLNEKQMANINKIVDNVLAIREDHFCFQVEESPEDTHTDIQTYEEVEGKASVMVINEAKLSRSEAMRLDHWRHGHRSSTGKRHEERCHTCEQSKHKSVYKANSNFNGTSI